MNIDSVHSNTVNVSHTFRLPMLIIVTIYTQNELPGPPHSSNPPKDRLSVQEVEDSFQQFNQVSATLNGAFQVRCSTRCLCTQYWYKHLTSMMHLKAFIRHSSLNKIGHMRNLAKWTSLAVARSVLIIFLSLHYKSHVYLAVSSFLL